MLTGMTNRDYIPGWNCWVSAYFTRTAGSQKYCECKFLLRGGLVLVPRAHADNLEAGLPECRKD